MLYKYEATYEVCFEGCLEAASNETAKDIMEYIENAISDGDWDKLFLREGHITEISVKKR